MYDTAMIACVTGLAVLSLYLFVEVRSLKSTMKEAGHELGKLVALQAEKEKL